MKKIILYIALSLNSASVLAANDAEIQAKLEDTARKMNATLPKKLNENTTVISVRAAPGKVLVISTLNNVLISQVTQQMISTAKLGAISHYCHAPSTRGAQDRGITEVHEEYDKNHVLIYTISLSKKDC